MGVEGVTCVAVGAEPVVHPCCVLLHVQLSLMTRRALEVGPAGVGALRAPSPSGALSLLDRRMLLQGLQPHEDSLLLLRTGLRQLSGEDGRRHTLTGSFKLGEPSFVVVDLLCHLVRLATGLFAVRRRLQGPPRGPCIPARGAS